jgi:hypothetical protein
LPFGAQNFNIWVGDSCLFKKKKTLNNEVTAMPLGGKKYICIERFLCLFFLNSTNTKLPMGFEKNKAYIGVFLSF